MNKQKYKGIWELLVLMVFLCGTVLFAAPTTQTDTLKTKDGKPVPKGLWQAFSEAQHAVEVSKESKEGYACKAYNPKNRYGVRYSKEGVSIKNANWEFGMQLKAYGQESTLTPVSKATLHSKGNTVTYERGKISEWYINGKQGLEQGFTLTKPKDYKENQELILSLAVEGELKPQLKTKEQSLTFYKGKTKAFDYEKLKAFDAKGETLPSRLALVDDKVQILVDAKGASWPVTVDPIFATEQKVVGVTTDTESNDYFGESVAIDGDTAVIGVYGDDDGVANSGSAFVFINTAAGWVTQAKLTASDATTDDNFGISVAIKNNTIVIGANKSDDAGESSGSAYVFVRSGTTWFEDQILTASDASSADEFGISVSLSSETYIIIGAQYADGINQATGAAYAFNRLASTWSETDKIIAPDGATNDAFGHAVAISESGYTVLIGAHVDEFSSGSAYIYTRLAVLWSLQQKLTASDSTNGDFFGFSVALEGETALIGAYQNDDGGSNSGSAYVFTRSATVWSEEQKLLALDDGIDDYFGYAVALDGDTALIGAYQDEGSKEGSAYVFIRSGSVWSQQQKLTASDGENFDFFGRSVAIDGNTVLVGAPFEDNDGLANSGSSYIFTRIGSVWSQEQKLTASKLNYNNDFGYSVSIDNDTALIGAYLDDDLGTDAGAAYVFFYSENTWTQQQKLKASDGTIGDTFGVSVSLLGDTALIGAFTADVGDIDTGAAYVFTRSGTTWSQQQKLIASDDIAYDYFGYSVALSEDTAIIGAYGVNVLNTDDGAAYVFVRSGTTWNQQQKLIADDPGNFDQFGVSVDISNDTVIIGANGVDTQSGSAYIFTRSGTIWSQQQKLIASDAADFDNFGFSVAIVDDIALIGAYRNDAGSEDSGAAYSFTRSGTVWSEQAKLSASDGSANDHFGIDISLSNSTALIGARSTDFNGLNSGSAYMFIRSGTAWIQIKKLIASDGQADESFGRSVSISGDTILVGAPDGYNAGRQNGSAYFNAFECGFAGSIIAETWTMVGLPCTVDANADTVEELFGDTLDPNYYYYRWVVYERDEATDTYVRLNPSDTVEQGKGYWIYSLDNSYWDASGSLTSYPVTFANGCSDPEGCYEIPLTSPDSVDTTRFNLVGYPSNTPIDWGGVRFVVDGSAYSPYRAEDLGYASKSIWKYNGNSYDAYDDTTPGMEGELNSHEGIWVHLLGGSSASTVKLLIPKNSTLSAPPPPPSL